MKTEMLLAIIPTIAIGVITFFIKRMIDVSDEKFKKLSNTLELIKDKQINQSEKRVEQRTNVNNALKQLHKDMENVREDIKSIPKMEYDLDNLGHKLRKIEDNN